MCYKNECVILRWILLFGVLFFSLLPLLSSLLGKKISLLCSLFSSRSQKKKLFRKKERKKKGTLVTTTTIQTTTRNSRRIHSRRRSLVESFYLPRVYSRILSSLFCCCCLGFCRRIISRIFSRDVGRTYVREERGRGAIFLLGLLRVKNVVGVLVADANAWMQILNFKCVRRVRLRAKEGLNCSSRLAVMMLARRVIFSHRVCDKDLSLTTLLLFSLLFHSYKTTSRTKTNTYIHINYAAKIRSKRRHRSFSSCHRW